MEYLQYKMRKNVELMNGKGFKPYYKWNTFNTKELALKNGGFSLF